MGVGSVSGSTPEQDLPKLLLGQDGASGDFPILGSLMNKCVIAWYLDLSVQ